MGKIELSVQSFSEIPADIQKIIRNSNTFPLKKNHMIYLLAGNKIYSCPDTEEGLLLIEHLSAGFSSDSITAEDQIWKSLLIGFADHTPVHEFNIINNIRRTVLVFRPAQHPERFTLQESIPMESSDRIIPMENGDVALILELKKRSEKEVIEYAEAVTETMESEAGIVCFAGIGTNAETLDSLSVSYTEAVNALQTGMRHHLKGRVFSYNRQTLERLSDLIPDDRAFAFWQKIITPEVQKILSDDLLVTIRTFFQNDLNLSTTARQLFIHRNTLIYRLDKVRRATGLDLKKFEDAVVFRFLMSFSERPDIYEKNKKEGLL